VRVSRRSRISSQDSLPLGRALAPPSALVEAREHRVERLLGLAAAATELHESGIDDDAMKPCRQARDAAKVCESAVRLQESFLHCIARILLVAEKTTRGGEQSPRLSPDESGERLVVTDDDALDEGIGSRAAREGDDCRHASLNHAGRREVPVRCGIASSTSELPCGLVAPKSLPPPDRLSLLGKCARTFLGVGAAIDDLVVLHRGLERFVAA
jgi:hypothetical protein